MVLFSLLDYWHHPKNARNSHHVLFPTLFELFFYNPKKNFSFDMGKNSVKNWHLD